MAKDSGKGDQNQGEQLKGDSNAGSADTSAKPGSESLGEGERLNPPDPNLQEGEQSPPKKNPNDDGGAPSPAPANARGARQAQGGAIGNAGAAQGVSSRELSERVPKRALAIYNADNHTSLTLDEVMTSGPEWLEKVMRRTFEALRGKAAPLTDAMIDEAYKAAYQAQSVEDHGENSPFSK